MPVASLVVLLNATQSLQHVNPYLIGGGVLLLLVLAVVGLLAFGAGRDHS